MARATVPALDAEQPSPPDDLIPPRPSGPLTFDPNLSDDPTPSPSDLPADDSPSPNDEPSDAYDEPSDAPPTSSTGSSAGSALSKRALRDAAREAVLAAGGIAHQVLARDELQADAGLWLADTDDAEAIGDPVANVVHRHGGLGAAGNPDLADAIAALIGLALYASKQIARWHQIRAARQNAAAHVAAAGQTDLPEGDSPQVAPFGPQNV